MRVARKKLCFSFFLLLVLRPRKTDAFITRSDGLICESHLFNQIGDPAPVPTRPPEQPTDPVLAALVQILLATTVFLVFLRALLKQFCGWRQSGIIHDS
ncbi:hypothetical protein PAPYR_11761 [Paratrimastix pyriformis]|uniref:Uncharacterized protein n=1 Tax=Paratrimastix pyriformis TaxID=342808 RepID=A0ABQ8U5U4_9EUKA|nr:hypothetical protein PAPYR_11761 [Paratrimastix pyriformis]